MSLLKQRQDIYFESLRIRLSKHDTQNWQSITHN